MIVRVIGDGLYIFLLSVRDRGMKHDPAKALKGKIRYPTLTLNLWVGYWTIYKYQDKVPGWASMMNYPWLRSLLEQNITPPKATLGTDELLTRTKC